MAAVKLATAAGALWLVDWRLRRPLPPGRKFGYVAAVAIMAAASALLWQLAFLAPAALLFHAGLFLALAVGWADGRAHPAAAATPSAGSNIDRRCGAICRGSTVGWR